MRMLFAFAAVALALSPTMASATTVAFTYSGAGEDSPNVVASGSGTISFNGTGALTLSNITGFSFQDAMSIGGGAAGSFSYSLADLLSFNAVFSNGVFSALSLGTDMVADPTGFLAGTSFQISIQPGVKTRANASTVFDDGDGATQGNVKFAAPVPEPAAWALMIGGFGAVGFTSRRRRARLGSVTFA